MKQAAQQRQREKVELAPVKTRVHVAVTVPVIRGDCAALNIDTEICTHVCVALLHASAV